MIDNLQNTNFGMNIKIDKNRDIVRKFFNLKSQSKVIGSPFTMDEARFFKNEAVTLGIMDCIAGILKPKGMNEFFMFHLDPKKIIENSWKNIETKLLKVQKFFFENGAESLEGFLVGAHHRDKLSMKQANKFINFYQKNNIDFSAILGQKEWNEVNLHYLSPKDEAAISFLNCENAKRPQDFKKYFAKVILGNDMFKFTN